MSVKNTLRMGCVLATCLLAIACSNDTQPENGLPTLAAAGTVTVSGISSGGYMAGQYQLAFSSEVAGAGIVAAGPWACAMGSVKRAIEECTAGTDVDIADLRSHAQNLAANDEIDPLENLRAHRQFLFHGRSDAIIGLSTVTASRQWIAPFLDEANIATVTDVPVVHGWPTKNYGAPCNEFTAPYINNCDYDLAGELLTHLYPALKPPADTVSATIAFDQQPFGDASLADTGYVYVPDSCKTSRGCNIHVFFHGCEQSATVIGTALTDNSGFNRWAESNNIIVLYPQVKESAFSPLNPLGCWDWWGYSGESYLAKTAPQLAAVRQMVRRLSE